MCSMMMIMLITSAQVMPNGGTTCNLHTLELKRSTFMVNVLSISA